MWWYYNKHSKGTGVPLYTNILLRHRPLWVEFADWLVPLNPLGKTSDDLLIHLNGLRVFFDSLAIVNSIKNVLNCFLRALLLGIERHDL